MAQAAMKIGAVAQRSGLSVKTIRFYCDEGLIHPTDRSEGGYRLFDDAVFEELRLIRTLKGMEIPLQQIAQILESRRSGVCTCNSIKHTITAKAGEIEQKIAALQALQAELQTLLSRWQDCGARKTPAAEVRLRAAGGTRPPRPGGTAGRSAPRSADRSPPDPAPAAR